MPLYVYECPACKKRESVFKKLAELDRPEQHSCGSAMQRVIVAPLVLGDYEPYNCPVTGREIRGRREHQENLKRHGCRVLEPGEREQFVREKQKREEAADREIEQLVEQTAQQMGGLSL